jgi:hypothetical protein
LQLVGNSVGGIERQHPTDHGTCNTSFTKDNVRMNCFLAAFLFYHVGVLGSSPNFDILLAAVMSCKNSHIKQHQDGQVLQKVIVVSAEKSNRKLPERLKQHTGKLMEPIRGQCATSEQL